MAKGNPIIKARVPRDLLAEIDTAVIQRVGVCHTRTDFILQAVREKLRGQDGEPIGMAEWCQQWRRFHERKGAK